MNINIEEIPFSRYGSYMAISHRKGNSDLGTESGLFLRTVHGAAADKTVLKIIPLYKNKEITYSYEATSWDITITTEFGFINICFANKDTLLIKGTGEGLGVRWGDITKSGSNYDYVHEVPYDNKIYWMLSFFKNRCRYIVLNQKGKISINQEWEEANANNCVIEFHETEGEFLAVIEEVATEWISKRFEYNYDTCVENIKDEFNKFYNSMPRVPAEYEKARELAAYVNWESVVSKHGFLTRDTMFMSKNHMCNVWSWDHCFNAMALAYNNPKLAWDQFMILFDHQDKTGVIPDCMNDSSIITNFAKPPIHGWALSKMIKVMTLTEEQIHGAFEVLSKWTNWWLDYRDHDYDGICEYYHGNDSGWDNSTAFRKVPTVELPDLAAFLTIQMDVLSDLAMKLGRIAEANLWKTKGDEMLSRMLSHCFEDGYPKAVVSRTHEIIENDSLILYLPIILGERLPKIIRDNIIGVLKSDKFYTAYGFATEAPESEFYVSDGYWRGPIWAPSTMIIIDGLYNCGEHEFAREATYKFCEMIQKSGFAENFDALTGNGLRDRAYTWTSSVFLVMAHEYLK